MPAICLTSDYLEKSFFFDMWLKATVFSESCTGMKIKGGHHSKTHKTKAKIGLATVTADLSRTKTQFEWPQSKRIIQLAACISSDSCADTFESLCVTARSHFKKTVSQTAIWNHFVQLILYKIAVVHLTFLFEWSKHDSERKCFSCRSNEFFWKTTFLFKYTTRLWIVLKPL